MMHERYELESDHEFRIRAKYCDRWCYFGSGIPAKTETTTNNAPWSGATPYISSGLSAAQDLYNQGGPQYYPGQTYAPENAAQSGSLTSLENIGNGLASGTAANNPSNSFFQGLSTGSNSIPGLSTLNNYANGNYLSADNPYFQQMANTVTANVLPGINAQFANAGRGNSGLAARAAGEGVADSIGGLAYNNYQQGLTQQQNAANSLAGYGITGAQGLSTNYQNNIANQLTGGTAALQAGTTQQGLDQASIADQMARYNYNAQLPYQNLQNYIANISGQIGGTGSSSSTQTAQPAQPSFWSQALGTGLTAASFFV